MARVYKIQISKIENEVKRQITISAISIAQYITDGWVAETEPYIDEPIAIKPADVVIANTVADVGPSAVTPSDAITAASDNDKATEAKLGNEVRAGVDVDAKAVADDDLLVD